MNQDQEPLKETEQLGNLQMFVDIGKNIVKAKTIDETLMRIMHQIGQIFMPLNWSVLLKNPKTGELTFTLVIGKSASKLQGLTLPPDEGIAGWIAQHGQPLIVEDVCHDRRFCNRIDEITGFETKSIIGVPLMTDEKVFGVIELINKLDGNRFSSLDLKLLMTIADFAALAIEKAYYAKALKRMASIDALTGVYNRGAFDKFYAREVERIRRYNDPFSLMMVDIDDFKNINDNHGHLAGDEVLKTMARILEDNVRKSDIVCRYGGDEFVVLMPETVKSQATKARERIREKLEQRNRRHPELAFFASIGLYAAESARDSDILQLLDSDLYREKDKKFARSMDSMADNLQDMLLDERGGL